MFADLQPAESAQAMFTANAYVIVHVGKTNQVNEEDSTWRPVRGLVYRFSVEPDVFFDSIGRPDLAGSARARHRSARTLSVGGYIFAVTGLFVTFGGFGEGHNAIGIAGLGALVGGAIAHEVGESMLTTPALREDKALDLAEAYNRQLRVRLGLPPEEQPPARDPWTGRSGDGAFGVAPLLFARGGGLGIGGRF